MPETWDFELVVAALIYLTPKKLDNIHFLERAHFLVIVNTEVLEVGNNYNHIMCSSCRNQSHTIVKDVII